MPGLEGPGPQTRLGLWISYLLTRLGTVSWLVFLQIDDTDPHLYFVYAAGAVQGREVYRDFELECPPAASRK